MLGATLQSAFYAHSAEFAMRALSCLGCLLLASASAVAGPVYKWKDAHGVTQYWRPRRPAKYETREQARSPQTATSTQTSGCTGARAVQHRPCQPGLAGWWRQVMQDTDGDGKADTPLSPEQRTAQKGLAEAAIKAYCPPAS